MFRDCATLLLFAGLASWPACTSKAYESQGDASAEASSSAPAAEPDAIKVQHVLIGFTDAVGFKGAAPPKASGRSRMEAERLAGDILKRAKAGEDFDGLVRQYTDDSPPGIYGMTNRGKKPIKGFYERDGMAPAFGDVGFPLKVGEIGMAGYDEMSSPYGWHIIKRIE